MALTVIFSALWSLICEPVLLAPLACACILAAFGLSYRLLSVRR